MSTLGWRISILTAVLSLAVLLPQGASTQPDVNALKKGVVRIRNTRHEEVGTGIIVKVTRDGVYVVTAAHVVRGDANPEVYLFTRQREPLRAMLINMEEDDRKGLALLWLKVDGEALAGLRALSIGSSSGLDGGEEVTLLGFPDGTSIWTVTRGTVARREGREVVFSGAVATGNSGGPLLHGGRVVGLVTDRGPTFSYAAQAESVTQYIRGVESELADLSAKPTPTATPRARPTPTPTPMPSPTPAADFCTVLTKLLVASEDGFHSIKGKLQSAEDNHYYPTIYLPGTASGKGWVVPDIRAYYFVSGDKDKGVVEAEYVKIVSQIRGCLPAWEHKEQRGGFRYYKFREGEKGKVVTVYYNEAPYDGTHDLRVSIYPRGNTEW